MKFDRALFKGLTRMHRTLYGAMQGPFTFFIRLYKTQIIQTSWTGCSHQLQIGVTRGVWNFFLNIVIRRNKGLAGELMASVGVNEPIILHSSPVNPHDFLPSIAYSLARQGHAPRDSPLARSLVAFSAATAFFFVWQLATACRALTYRLCRWSSHPKEKKTTLQGTLFQNKLV